MLYDEGKLDTAEFSIYKRWYDVFLKDIPVHARIYIETTPDICNERVIVRARPGEIIPLEYLGKCHQYHEGWLSQQAREGISILRLNGNQDIFANPDVMTGWLGRIESFLGDVDITGKLTKTDSASLY
jgi:deoxyadenosine/deoxycytidine kinase